MKKFLINSYLFFVYLVIAILLILNIITLFLFGFPNISNKLDIIVSIEDIIIFYLMYKSIYLMKNLSHKITTTKFDYFVAVIPFIIAIIIYPIHYYAIRYLFIN